MVIRQTTQPVLLPMPRLTPFEETQNARYSTFSLKHPESWTGIALLALAYMLACRKGQVLEH